MPESTSASPSTLPRIPLPSSAVSERSPAAWTADGVELSGAALAVLGLPMPILHPEHALVITVEETA